MAGSERGVARVEATEGRGMAPRPGNVRSEQIWEGSGLFVFELLRKQEPCKILYSVNNFLEFVKIILYIVVLLVFVHSK